mmetsp:Transcript_10514/g.16126  ORF Transcript_10514/g.16126 Transcript_10514/m.16126 type:complete len:309 (-) Transcript_10514:349-1275(-)
MTKARNKEDNDNTISSSWKWKDGLSIYAGDEIQQHLLSMGISHRDVLMLRSPGGLQQALNVVNGNNKNACKGGTESSSPWMLQKNHYNHILMALEEISIQRGYNPVLTKSTLSTAIDNMESPPNQLGVSRGKQLSELDVIVGHYYKKGLSNLGRSVGIDFDFNVDFCWYPVESQRILFYASNFGAQEAYVDALARRHFTKGQASGNIETVIDAAVEVGLDRQDVVAFLVNSDEYYNDVWQSYQDTVGKHNIHSIPFFTFNGPKKDGGIFRKHGLGNGEHIVRGSGNVNQFLNVFERIQSEMILNGDLY